MAAGRTAKGGAAKDGRPGRAAAKKRASAKGAANGRANGKDVPEFQDVDFVGESWIDKMAKLHGITSTEDVNIAGMLKDYQDPNEDAVALVRLVRGSPSTA